MFLSSFPHRAPAVLSLSLSLSALMVPVLPTAASDSQIPLNTRAATARSEIPTYVLGPGDNLDITVFDYTEFTGPKVVLPDGTITLPLIGAVTVTGKTTEQLAQELSRRLQIYLVNPVVTVSLVNLRPVVVNVSGEVQRPGPVQLRGLTSARANMGDNASPGDSAPTVATAIALAGGITREADIRQVVIRRAGGAGGAASTTVNLWDSIQSDVPPSALVLQDGDAVYIPRLAAGAAVDPRLTARSSYAPATVRVRVVGEVVRPGEVQVPPNSSLSSAVAIAGGPTEDARLSQVAFVRMDADGRISRQTVDLRNLTDTFQVQDGDVIIVPKKGSATALDTVGRLLPPFGFLLNLINLF